MSSDPTPEKKALDYVTSLGLNSVYEQAVAAHENLKKNQDQLLGAKTAKRSLESHKTDVEMELMEEERSRHPDMSQAQMDKHLKVAFSNNAEWRETRDQIEARQSAIDAYETQQHLLDSEIKITVARLHELGGYFQFMAVIKQAGEARKANTRETGNPW